MHHFKEIKSQFEKHFKNQAFDSGNTFIGAYFGGFFFIYGGLSVSCMDVMLIHWRHNLVLTQVPLFFPKATSCHSLGCFGTAEAAEISTYISLFTF